MAGPMSSSFNSPRGGLPRENAITRLQKYKTNASIRKELKRIFSLLIPFKWSLIAVFILAILSVVFSVIGPLFISDVTDELADGVLRIIRGSDSGIDFKYVGQTLLFLIGIYVTSAIFNLIQSLMMAKITTRFSYNLRKKILHKLNRLPVSYYSTSVQGNILSIITNDVDTVENGLNTSITKMISSIVQIIGITVIMFTISWQMALVVLGISPLSVIVVFILVKISQKHFRNNQRYLGKVNGQIEEFLSAHVILSAFNYEESASESFRNNNEILKGHSFKAEFLSGLIYPSNNFIGNLSFILVCIIGAINVTSGVISIGNIQAFIMYSKSFNRPIIDLSNISSQLQRMAAASERIFGLLEEDEEKEPEDNSQLPDRIKGEVEFRHVKFGYHKDKTIIKDFSLTAHAGQKIAIVGPTGAGKTTLVKLLMRYYDLDGGTILLDGHDIAKYDRHEIRKYFGMVLQDTWLFKGTIKENIRYGRLDATDEEVIEAARTAQADSFISTLPHGYDLVINEDSDNISQGQKQLLTIARAVLADPPVLILDEATSSVDTRTEVLIQKAMDKLLEGRTSFIIAHRYSTIRNADMILCINDGEIVEQGSHRELFEKNGFYSSLYKDQFSNLTDNDTL
jgi:ATP-binding cassette subfamily B protein